MFTGNSQLMKSRGYVSVVKS